MDEETWLACADPLPMLEFLRGKVSERKLRLLAVAFCQRVFGLLDSVGRDGLKVVEQRAEGQASLRRLAQARRAVCLAAHRQPRGAYATPSDDAQHSASMAVLAALCDDANSGIGQQGWKTGGRDEAGDAFGIASDFGCEYHAARAVQNVDLRTQERHAQTRIVQDLFGNPFRPVVFDPAWRTANVIALAEAIYAERAFDRLPILADSLEEVGCCNAAILDHCRQPGEHVRGCFLVDLLLGKE